MAFSKSKTQSYIPLLFLAPSFLGLSVFYIIPFIWMIYYSFIDSPINGSFVGFENYINLLNNDAFRMAMKNSLTFMGISVPLIIIMSLILAILLNKITFIRDKITTGFIVPLIIPIASIIVFFDVLFDNNGVINNILLHLNLQRIDWENSGYRIIVIITMYIWKNLGYNMVLFLAGINNIPKEYYEAAQMDGANSFQCFYNTTLIYLMPTSFFVFVISIINSFKVFRETYVLDGNYPNQSIYMLQHYMNNMFYKLDYHKLVTAAILLALIIYILIFILYKLQKAANNLIND